MSSVYGSPPLHLGHTFNLRNGPCYKPRVTVESPVGICRECGRDIPGAHESMKCDRCRSFSEEWKNAD